MREDGGSNGTGCTCGAAAPWRNTDEHERVVACTCSTEHSAPELYVLPGDVGADVVQEFQYVDCHVCGEESMEFAADVAFPVCVSCGSLCHSCSEIVNCWCVPERIINDIEGYELIVHRYENAVC